MGNILSCDANVTVLDRRREKFPFRKLLPLDEVVAVGGSKTELLEGKVDESHCESFLLEDVFMSALLFKALSNSAAASIFRVNLQSTE